MESREVAVALTDAFMQHPLGGYFPREFYLDRLGNYDLASKAFFDPYGTGKPRNYLIFPPNGNSRDGDGIAYSISLCRIFPTGTGCREWGVVDEIRYRALLALGVFPYDKMLDMLRSDPEIVGVINKSTSPVGLLAEHKSTRRYEGRRGALVTRRPVVVVSGLQEKDLEKLLRWEEGHTVLRVSKG